MRDVLTSALRRALGELGLDAPEEIHLEQPARREHGDWSSNVAMKLARRPGGNPRELAQDVVDRIAAAPPAHVVGVEIAGPGFVNFRLDDGWLHDVIPRCSPPVRTSAAAASARVARSWSSSSRANPTGPLHAGHARGAAYGDSLARLLERTGHDVAREFYINDRGVQMQNFADVAARPGKAASEPPEGGYQGQYITDWAAEMPEGADPLGVGRGARARQDQRETLGRA